MRLFILFFFITYGLMHLYALIRARSAFRAGWYVWAGVGLLMLLMVVAPFLVRMLENRGNEPAAMVMAFVGYTWLGLIFLYVSASIAVDIYRLILMLLPSGNYESLRISAATAFYIPLALSVGISLYGYFEARDIRTEHIVLESPKIPEGTRGIRIAQISDVHLGLIVREDRLRLITDAIRNANPDILVSTGDLVDGQISRLDGLSNMLNEINPPLGKFAITGNHEYYAGLEQSLAFTNSAGFRMLRGEAVNIQGLITIAGVDDRTDDYFGGSRKKIESRMLSGLDNDRFTLFLKHRPSVSPESRGLFDLQLSGHTHKGQIFPFNIVTWLYYPVHSGCLTEVGGCMLYVSRGSGTWGPPIRFLSPPEVTLIELVPAADTGIK